MSSIADGDLQVHAAAAEAGGVMTRTTRKVSPCGDSRRPAEPDRVRNRPTLAVTLSGGGFRATLAAAGALRAIADAGRLADVRFVSSVSGGSIANAMLATRWNDLHRSGFSTAALDQHLIGPLVRSISASSMKAEIVRNAWKALGRRTRTDVLADVLDNRFFNGAELASLPGNCRFVFNCANLRTGARFAFERDVLGDYVTGLASTDGTGLRVADAVAASAAVPGAFAAKVVRDVQFPCTASGTPQLVDGGAYDNSGLEPFSHPRYRDIVSISLNAGGLLRVGAYGRIPIVSSLARANSLLYRQSTGLRTRLMVERFQAWEQSPERNKPEWARRGVLVELASTIPATRAEPWRASHPEHRTWRNTDMADVPTVFDRLDERLCRALVYRGWWLVGAALSAYQPDLAPSPEVTAPEL